MSFSAVGTVYTPEEFSTFLATLPRPQWVRAITLHHTSSPSLAQRPKGLLPQHIRNIRDFYREKKWSSGPHLFIDDTHRCIMGMTPLDERGTHAVSFNATALGIEVLGDYDSEDPTTGRGLTAWRNAAAATRHLLDWLHLTASKDIILFHRDDPRTTKTCPGTRVRKEWFLSLL